MDRCFNTQNHLLLNAAYFSPVFGSDSDHVHWDYLESKEIEDESRAVTGRKQEATETTKDEQNDGYR